MTSADPTTGAPLPPDAIQRVLFIASSVHVYSIPPLTSTKGYNASQWTADNNKRQIFTARLRILETAIPSPDSTNETVTTHVLLEDPSSGQLFAAAPYTDAGAVEQVLDSSRFFAVRVVGEGGRKAVLGIGFEERSEAFDFGIALQEVRKVQGIDKDAGPIGARKASGGKAAASAEEKPESQKDYSLKEGQVIRVDIGRKGRRPLKEESRNAEADDRALFSIAPPPQRDKGSFLPPPPPPPHVKVETRSRTPEPAAADLGFDDGEFGEFQ